MAQTPPRPPTPVRVVVVDLNMSFGSMVVFMVKWVIAAIPAMLILGAIALMVVTVVIGIGANQLK